MMTTPEASAKTRAFGNHCASQSRLDCQRAALCWPVNAISIFCIYNSISTAVG